MKNILLTDAGYKHTLGAVRSISQAGYNAYVLTNKKKSFCSGSNYCKGEIVVSQDSVESFTSSLLEQLKKYEIDLLIPIGSGSIKLFSGIKNKIADSTFTRMITPDEDQLDLCLSKERTYRFADQIGLLTPRSFYPERQDDVIEISGKTSYPCVIKGRFETGYSIVDYAQSADELIKKYDALCRRYHLFSSKELPLVQEYVKGTGCGFFAVYDHGQCGITFQHRRIREMPPSGGYSVAAESWKNQAVHEHGKKILTALKWHGVAMVEFKLTAENNPVLMEINPKFWGSLDLALAAGVNFPLAVINLAQHIPLEYSEDYICPLKFHWPLDGDLQYMFKKPSSSLAIIGDCLNPNVKSNLWLRSDFKMTCIQFWNMIKRGLVHLRNRVRK